MPVPVFEPALAVKKTNQYDAWRVSRATAFFAILMVLLLAATVELALWDVNRIYNPQYSECLSDENVITRIFKIGSYSSEICDVQRYEASRLLLHADVIVPVLVVSIIMLAILMRRRKDILSKVFTIALSIFSSWLTIRLIYEAESYTLKHHLLFGKYFVLLTALIIVILMIFWVEWAIDRKRKGKEKKEEGKK